MCDLPEAFSTNTRTAAKQHKCCECGTTIEKGEQYQYSSGVWDGRPDSYKQCINCHELMSAAVMREEYGRRYRRRAGEAEPAFVRITIEVCGGSEATVHTTDLLYEEI